MQIAAYSLVLHVINVQITCIYSVYKSSVRLTPTFIRDLRPGYPETWL